ncbi:TetR/AcrR family transcriptional regulator [Actinoallomurus sp. CA-150999]|uniref:TetR/AcrR family transcriptional regulator n=1 Tax=Actinoallomurus sp. CA-150999 TaxID=3239887 RepID=UPI003D901D53
MDRSAVSSGDRRSPAKHRAILRAATEVFLREGYARASVDAIAAAAGVGKQTVYGHFGNKQRLFQAVVEEARDATGVTLEDVAALLAEPGDPRAVLEVVAEHLLRAITAPDHAALHRLTIAELPHHPELQRSWRDDGTAVTEVIAAYLAERDRQGELSVPDPVRIARQFATLLGAEGQVRSLRGAEQLTDAQFQEIARETTDLIIRACRVGDTGSTRRTAR